MFDFSNTTEKLSRTMRKMIAPREAFTQQTKMAFLAVFDAMHPQTRSTHAVTAFAKTFIAGGALLGIFAGMSVYADTANVAADSSLYPLKRLGENVQLVLAPSVEKPQLQATFAARRAKEITDLSTRKPTSTIIVSLNKDLDNDVDNSINAAAATNLSDGKLNDFCGTVFSVIASSSLSGHGKSSIHSRSLARFEGECAVNVNASTTENVSSTQNDGNTNDATDTKGAMIFKVKNPFSHLFVNATTTVQDASSGDEAEVTGTIDSIGTDDNSTTTLDVASTTFWVRGGGRLNIIFENPSGDTSDAATTTLDIKKGGNGRGHNKQND